MATSWKSQLGNGDIGVRPFCILKSNVFVLRKEDEGK